ncbi:MAG: polysaccharide deacetylase family protein [bacterium]
MATVASGVAMRGGAVWKWARLPVWLVTHDRQPGVVVLMYHCVGGGTSLEIDMPASLMARHIDHLRRAYRIIALDDLISIARRTAGAPGADQLVLTFDDGHEGIFTDVFPILLRHRIPATVYVPTAYVEEQRRFDWGGYAHLPEALRPRPMTWSQIRDLARSGLVSIGVHTHSHADLSVASPERIQRELEVSGALMVQRLGARPRHFAYPYGRTSPAAARIVAKCYDTAVIIGSARNAYGAIDLRALHRVPVSARDGYWFFRLKLPALDAHTSPGFASIPSGQGTEEGR